MRTGMYQMRSRLMAVRLSDGYAMYGLSGREEIAYW